ncbi:MAG: FAD:protein FMN transferase, partial [Acidimicrobiales bacterium]
RFIPSSDIAQLNRNAGCVTIVSADCYKLIDTAVKAQTLTAGRFNPLMLTQLQGLGYDRSWDEREPVERAFDSYPGSQHQVLLYPEISAVRIPEQTAFDPGGIGKGLAADMAVDLLVANGATTISVELGGDLRVHGKCWYGSSWRVGVADPFHPQSNVGSFTIDRGAVATSSTLRRRWTSSDGTQHHHLLDPRTGRSAQTDLVAVTTCTSTGWWAEVLAKTALIAGSAEAIQLLDGHETSGLVVTTDGNTMSTTELVPA